MNISKKELKKINEKINKLNDEELNEEFIKYFGKEKFDEIEMQGKLFPYMLLICKDLELELIPMSYAILSVDSRLDLKNLEIEISIVYKEDFIESLKCLIHELRHYYQVVTINCKKELTYIEKQWKDNFDNPVELSGKNLIEEITNYSFQSIEIDATAYTQLMMKKLLNEIIIHPNDLYQGIIDLYIQKYLK